MFANSKLLANRNNFIHKSQTSRRIRANSAGPVTTWETGVSLRDLRLYSVTITATTIGKDCLVNRYTGIYLRFVKHLVAGLTLSLR